MWYLALSVIYNDVEKSFSTAVYIIHYITQPKVYQFLSVRNLACATQ